jgi:WD40 repeat protein/serine/threonine protein kinase/tetratricopeptide (TPR) repeat protein
MNQVEMDPGTGMARAEPSPRSVPIQEDPRLAQALEEYILALETGAVPDRQRFVARHADIADVLVECLEGLEFIRTAAGQVREPAPDNPPGSQDSAAVVHPEGPLGDYRLVREVGRGGMGVVYEAVQISLGRRVALKVLPFAAALDAKQLQRFKNEAQAAAHLQHQNIVPVYGVGCERGVHYYAMQFIDGQTLAALIHELRQSAGLQAADPAAVRSPASSLASELAAGRWAPARSGAVPAGEQTGPYSPGPDAPVGQVSNLPEIPGKLETCPTAETATPPVAALSTEPGTKNPAFFRTVANLGVQAAEALEHAYQLGVVHRDIKPANLLVDTRGNLWITDFGLAHCQSQAGLTMTGDLVGTLRYMSPEQALAKRVLVDHRTDVYSLGATLYELLTLEPVFDGRDRQELLRQIAFEEPRPLRRLNKSVPAELETIVLKAMEKNPAERYGTAQELADDLGRFLEDRPIRARRPTLRQRARKWARRHRGVVMTMALALALLLLGGVTGLWVAFFHINAAREEAEDNAAKAENNAATAKANAATAKANAAKERKAKNNARRAKKQAEERLVRVHVAHGIHLLEAGDLMGSLPWFAEALRLERGGPQREQMHRLRLGAILGRCPKLVQVLSLPGDWGQEFEFSPNGRYLAAFGGVWRDDGGQSAREARVWDVVTGRPVTPALRHKGGVIAALFSPDGRRLVTTSVPGPNHASEVRVWDIARGRLSLKSACVNLPRLPAFSPDSRRLVIVEPAGIARVWDVVTGQALTPPLKDRGGAAPCFSPDGRYVVTSCVWEATSGALVTRLLPDPGYLWQALFSPDGRFILTFGGRKTGLRLWDAATGRPVRSFWANTGFNGLKVSFSPDGRHVMAGPERTSTLGKAYRNTVWLWDTASGELATAPLNLPSSANNVVFSPDSRCVLTASDDGTARLWDVKTGRLAAPPLRQRGVVKKGAFSRDGRFVLTVGHDGAVRRWDLAGASSMPVRLFHAGMVAWASFSPDSRRVVTASWDGTARIWDAATGQPLTPPLPHVGEVDHAVFSPDGRRVATWNRMGDRYARVWNAATGQPVTPLLVHKFGIVKAVAFSPDTRWVVTAAGQDGQVWDAATGQRLTPPMLHPAGVQDAAFSPGGRRLVTTSADGKVRVWAAANGRPLTPPLSAGGATTARFTADGRSVVAVSLTGTMQTWDAATGASLGQAPSRRGRYKDTVRTWLSADGRRAVTSSSDLTARVWDVATGRPLSPPLQHSEVGMHASFDPDGRRVVTASLDRTARVWDVAAGSLVSPFLQHAHGVLHAEFSPDGRRVVSASDDGTAQVWDLPRDDHPVQDLRRLAELLAGYRIDATQSCVPLEAHELRATWKALQARYPQDFAASPEQVLAWHRRAAQDCEQGRQWSAALLHLDWLIRVEPARWPYRAARARAHTGLGHFDKSVADYEQAIERGADDRRVADGLTNEGLRLEAAGRHKEAEKAFRLGLAFWEKLAAKFPKRPDYQSELACQLHMVARQLVYRKQLAKAHLLYEQAIGHQQQAARKARFWDHPTWTWQAPGFGTYQTRLSMHYQSFATNLVRLGRHGAAAKAVEELLRLFPNQNGPGEYRYAGGVLTDCVPLAEKDPKLPEEQRKKVAQAYTDRARELLGKSALMSVSDAAGQNKVAWLLATHRDVRFRTPRQAVELATKAVEKEPKNGGYWNTLGVARYRAGDWKGTVAALEKSMELRKGGTSEDWFFLAMAHWQLGRRDQARQWYDRAVVWMKKNKPAIEKLMAFRAESEELQRFRAEAAGLMGIKEKH